MDGILQTAFDDSRFVRCPSPAKETPLRWRRSPSRVLMIKKRDDDEITDQLSRIANWLQTEHNITPLIEPCAKEDLPHLQALDMADIPFSDTTIDFVVCLGGDGALLHVNSIFGERVPPVVAFFYGTLGFLTAFHIDQYQEVLNRVISGDACLTLRSRLHCKLYRSNKPHVDEEKGCFGGDREDFHILNEAVIDRGNSPYLTDVLCYCNDVQITTVRADGIIISSPTGSTAYSLSAGASIIHPLVPGIIFTPICPHTLSFRPVVFPDCVQLKFKIPSGARSSGWISFDGRFRKRLDADEYLTIETSHFPFPSVTMPICTRINKLVLSVCYECGTNDNGCVCTSMCECTYMCVSKDGVLVEWFKDLANIFHWNDRPTH
jgi:NAD+ kinase